MKAFSKIAIVLCVAASACAAVSTRAHQPSFAVIDESGVRSREMSIDAGDTLTFVNADRTAHQIYSPECPELGSVVLHPGETYGAVVGAGPKVCHFLDLLAPNREAYAGTIQVRRSAPDPIFADEA